jgi:hypothetical protein
LGNARGDTVVTLGDAQPLFSSFDPDVVEEFVQHGIMETLQRYPRRGDLDDRYWLKPPEASAYTLKCDRNFEARMYAGGFQDLWASLRRVNASVTVAVGTDSPPSPVFGDAVERYRRIAAQLVLGSFIVRARRPRACAAYAPAIAFACLRCALLSLFLLLYDV